MKAFLLIEGSSFSACSASRYCNTSAFGGSSKVTTLKCRSVCAGHDALMIAAALFNSFAERGARGCDGTVFAVRDWGSVADVSVDMLKTTMFVTLLESRGNGKEGG
jgi:hypothetical protein